MRRTLLLTVIASLSALALVGSLSAASASEARLTITMTGKQSNGVGSGKFKLIGASTAFSDSGRFSYPTPVESLPLKTAEGLTYVVVKSTETLKGKHGTLVIRSTVRRHDVVKVDDSVSTGTWSIVKGTGRYVGLKGGGELVGLTQAAKNASDFSQYDISARYEGFTTGS